MVLLIPNWVLSNSFRRLSSVICCFCSADSNYKRANSYWYMYKREHKTDMNSLAAFDDDWEHFERQLT